MKTYNTAAKVRVDLTGNSYSQLKVIRLLGTYKSAAYYECLCVCGATAEVRADALTSKITKSCGCLRKERNKTSNLQHGFGRIGESRHPMYHSWSNVVQRCTNPKSSGWEHYGGRGISIPTEWLVFANFLLEMSEGWSEGMTLERKDANKSYSKDNCTWIPRNEQSSNTRRSLVLTYKGENYTVKALAEHKGITYAALISRLKRYDITPEQAVDGFCSKIYTQLSEPRNLDCYRKYRNDFDFE